MPKFRLHNSVNQHNYVFNLLNKASLQIKEIANYENLKLSPELTKSVCIFVEDSVNSFPKKHRKVNKKQIVIDVIKNVFTSLTEDEIKNIEQQIDFLLQNKMIVSTSTLTKAKDAFSKFFLNK